ncbi:hypothetical protein, partial [Mesorhizobium sp.]|uniref:hypothetical protein n=1 Tax=Mesorhizobium sp. TaxID=1871066 RepID=UPI00257B7490
GGLFFAERFFDATPPSGKISESVIPLSEETLVGADASILDFIRDADQRPCRLVVSGRQIEGLVSISDMQKLPVRAALFCSRDSIRDVHGGCDKKTLRNAGPLAGEA